MGLNEVPSSARTHISFFGRRNAGKSSLVNAVTGQNLAVVSEVKGTTTDPVSKAMELLPLGPVVITDTAGIDDTGELGNLRIQKTIEQLNKTHIAVLVIDASVGTGEYEDKLIEQFKKRNIPYIEVYNKADLVQSSDGKLYVSAKTGLNIEKLKECIASLKPEENKMRMVADFISKGDTVIFVIPIDESAPKGRLILPQQQAIRDVLDAGGVAIACGTNELENTLSVYKPKLVVTDSQVFGKVSEIVPESINLTSFSILMARIKGLLDSALKGAYVLDKIKDGDRILISEGCTHHRQCNDIGTVKLPNLIRKYTGRDVQFEFTSGGEFKDKLDGYSLVIHCGGCMLNDTEMKSRVNFANEQNVPITNYGTAIAHMNGILERSIQIINGRS